MMLNVNAAAEVQEVQGQVLLWRTTNIQITDQF